MRWIAKHVGPFALDLLCVIYRPPTHLPTLRPWQLLGERRLIRGVYSRLCVGFVGATSVSCGAVRGQSINQSTHAGDREHGLLSVALRQNAPTYLMRWPVCPSSVSVMFSRKPARTTSHCRRRC